VLEVILYGPQGLRPADASPNAHVIPSAHIRRITLAGIPLTVQLWTAEEWAALPEPVRPADARQFANGIYVTARLG